MAFAQDERCNRCGGRVDIVIVAATGKAMAFDDTREHRGGDALARWAIFPDRRTGTPRARRLKPREHLEPDEELARSHYTTCPAANRDQQYR